jgi:hypothetical protein
VTRFPTQNLFIEGPDLSGKTSLISEVHNQTSYKWHIFDRSQISRHIFCDLYERNYPHQELDLINDLCNLNNRFFFLLPEKKKILKRYSIRGDEIHDIASLLVVYEQFKSFLNSFPAIPNLYRFENLDYDLPSLAEFISTILNDLENIEDLEKVSDYVYASVSAAPTKEHYPLSFFLMDDGSFSLADCKILENKDEGEYYKTIHSKLMDKIEKELKGENSYERKETFSSRRFVFSDDSCISFIQVANRNNIFDFHAVLRSSDVKNIFPTDLKFLYYLAAECYKKTSLQNTAARIRINLNSAHILG